MMPGFLYKERQKREHSNISGVVSTPDYSEIEPNAALREKIRREVNKSSR